MSNNAKPTTTLKIRVAQPEDSERVVEFLKDNFYPYAPLTSCEPKRIVTVEDENNLHECIGYGCSLMALKDDQLVGVSVAMPQKRSSIDGYFATAKKLGNTKAGQMFRLLGEVNRDASVFDRYGVDEILYLFLSSVAPNHRGSNIATLMTQELMRLGKEKWNYQVLTVDCSSFYCAQVCERLGMECINTVIFSEYLDENGNPIFKPAAPHVAMKTYAQLLSSSNML